MDPDADFVARGRSGLKLATSQPIQEKISQPDGKAESMEMTHDATQLHKALLAITQIEHYIVSLDVV